LPGPVQGRPGTLQSPQGRGTPVSIEPVASTRPPRGHEDASQPIETLLQRGAEALAASLDEFDFVLATVRYPLMMSAITLRWRQPLR
jgi:hypothetical protein